MAERESGVVTWAVLALSVAVCAAGAVLLWLVMTNREPTGTSAPEPVEQRLEAQSFDEYSWEELAEVAALISAAPTDEEGRSVAEKYGVAVGDTCALPLEDGRAASLTVVGIRTDDRADGTGRAGLTLMASPIARRPMNEAATTRADGRRPRCAPGSRARGSTCCPTPCPKRSSRSRSARTTSASPPTPHR